MIFCVQLLVHFKILVGMRTALISSKISFCGARTDTPYACTTQSSTTVVFSLFQPVGDYTEFVLCHVCLGRNKTFQIAGRPCFHGIHRQDDVWRVQHHHHHCAGQHAHCDAQQLLPEDHRKHALVGLLFAVLSLRWSDQHCLFTSVSFPLQDDSDTEWKFARSKLWMSYFEEGATVPPPFNIIPTPKTIIHVLSWVKERCCMCTKQQKRSKWQSIRVSLCFQLDSLLFIEYVFTCFDVLFSRGHGSASRASFSRSSTAPTASCTMALFCCSKQQQKRFVVWLDKIAR